MTLATCYLRFGLSSVSMTGLLRSRMSSASTGLAAVLCLVVVSAGSGCTFGQSSTDGDEISASFETTVTHVPSPGPADGEWFTDSAEEVGLDFVHFNGMSGEFYQPEVMGPGVAMFDFDNDGDLDVYLVQGETIGDQPPRVVSPAGAPPSGRLYRNDLRDHPDGPRLVFTDVASGSGLQASGYGTGIATGDIDNDGWVDLYLTGFGRNQMFRNNGDGTFNDVSVRSGTGDSASWGVSASFLDYDRDGWLDLFVGNYLSFSLETHIPCFNRSGPPDYCPPEVYRAQPDRLYRNLGDGTFADVTTAAGVAYTFGPALGVATADFDNDGWIDIFVANDQQENQLWVNQHDGTFVNMAPLWGAALGANGEAKADMGVDAGDFDNDGDEDLFITELVSQGSTLYVNDGAGVFDERSVQTFVRLHSLPYTGFGTSWFDFDNDGWLDLLAVNGQVTQDLETLGPNNFFPLQQRNLLLRNLGNRRFEDVTDRGGEVFRLLEVSRGAAFGDVDNDGDTDVVVGNDAGPVRLLINHVGNRHHWLGLRLVGEASPRDMIGARVEVVDEEGTRLWRRARSDGSYASAQDPRVLVGLGMSTNSPLVRVVWPSGRVEEWTALPVDRYTTLREGEGR
ncbi:MAG: CRTAC1 family protein [Acidobacteriota bacterium]|nr:CRTAC1 family protein [Acidobacteriota bacterium]